MDKIIFFNMNQIGDLLFALPVMKAARKQYPNTKIYCVIKENLKDLLISANVSDEIFVKGKTFKDKLILISRIKKENIDTAVLFSESPESLLTAFCSGIKNRIGFKTASLNFLLTKKTAVRFTTPPFFYFNLLNNSLHYKKKLLTTNY